MAILRRSTRFLNRYAPNQRFLTAFTYFSRQGDYNGRQSWQEFFKRNRAARDTRGSVPMKYLSKIFSYLMIRKFWIRLWILLLDNLSLNLLQNRLKSLTFAVYNYKQEIHIRVCRPTDNYYIRSSFRYRTNNSRKVLTLPLYRKAINF